MRCSSICNGVSVYRAVDGGKDFVFVEFNRAGELIEGIDAQSVVGRRLSEVFPAWPKWA